MSLEESKKEEARRKLPEALSIQKKKFLIAINKCDDQEFDKGDEEFVKKVIGDLYQGSLFDIESGTSLGYEWWHDSLAAARVKTLLEENAIFDLNKYLDCARLLLVSYSGIWVTGAPTAANYVLTHARQLGDTSKTIFQTNDDINTSSQQDKNCVSAVFVSKPLRYSKFMKKIEELIEDLRIMYDENKFIVLNTNVTYITLLKLRKNVKNEADCVAAFTRMPTHDNYVNLCPWPLDNMLPTCDTSKLAQGALRTCSYLAIEAYLNTEDEKTKKALKVTCVKYMKWNGFQLPYLFFKVVELYGIDAGTLWDLLCSEKTAKSLMLFAHVYYVKYKDLKHDPTKTQRWLPYCRVLQTNCHKNLSAPENKHICLVLAYLVDFKVGFDKSTVRLSRCFGSNECMWKQTCLQLAEKIKREINSLTSDLDDDFLDEFDNINV